MENSANEVAPAFRATANPFDPDMKWQKTLSKPATKLTPWFGPNLHASYSSTYRTSFDQYQTMITTSPVTVGCAGPGQFVPFFTGVDDVTSEPFVFNVFETVTPP